MAFVNQFQKEPDELVASSNHCSYWNRDGVVGSHASFHLNFCVTGAMLGYWECPPCRVLAGIQFPPTNGLVLLVKPSLKFENKVWVEEITNWLLKKRDITCLWRLLHVYESLHSFKLGGLETNSEGAAIAQDFVFFCTSRLGTDTSNNVSVFKATPLNFPVMIETLPEDI